MRKTDEAEIFTIRKQRWVKTWMNQPRPVMPVIGTYSEEDGRFDVMSVRRWREQERAVRSS